MSEKEIKLSPQQEIAENFCANPGGNGLLKAVAGSGKTFTLMRICGVLDGYASICAYNTSIANEIEGKIQKIKLKDGTRVFVGTCHRFGRRALVKHFPKCKVPNTKKGEKSKTQILMEEVPHKSERGVPIYLMPFVSKAYDLARQAGAGVLPEFPFKSRETWLDLVEHFDLRDVFANSDGDLPIDIDSLVSEGCNWTVRVIKYGIERCKDIIDFEDMIYAVLYLNLRVEPNNWVLVDECQDINPTRRALIKKMITVGGRALFVGDPHQAIYGFTGADAKSFENIKKEFNCTELDLTWSFRCAQSVVRFVQQWVNHIQASPEAPEGLVMTMDAESMWKPVMIGTNYFTGVTETQSELTIADAILCRNNAPLVDLFFALLKRGIPSHIEGKDLSGKLLKMSGRWPKIKSLVALGGKLVEYKERQVQKSLASGREDRAGEVSDTVDSIMAIIEGLPKGSSTKDLQNKIIEMFGDSKEERCENTLTLTTIHKSKGREWNRVFWYGRNRWNPSSYARQDWQMEQETHLMYVAGTRAKTTLVDVVVPIPLMKKRW
jgi:hypothetical protein